MKDHSTLVLAPGGVKSIVLENSIKIIGNDAFINCSQLKSINIPDSVETIGERAFINCNGLILVTIGKGLTMVSKLAFAACSNLKAQRFDGVNVPTVVSGEGF